MNFDETTLMLYASTQEYNLPDDFAQMVQIWDTETFNQELKRITPIEYKMHLGDITGNTGTNPIYYDIIGSGASGTTYRKKIKFFPYPSSGTLQGRIATFAQLTGVPAAFTNYNATVAGTVLITDVAHGLVTGMSVVIAGTVNYNGTFVVTVVDVDNFYITATFVAEAGGGTWTAVGTSITDIDHGLATGNYVIITGTTNYNATYTVWVRSTSIFHISATYVAEAGANTKIWYKGHACPFVYLKSLDYLSATTDENALSYMYPQLYLEGGIYYIMRDYIYRDQPEKIAFRKAEFEKVKNQVKAEVSQPDYIRGVIPKRLLSSIVQSNRLYRTQYSNYQS